MTPHQDILSSDLARTCFCADSTFSLESQQLQMWSDNHAQPGPGSTEEWLQLVLELGQMNLWDLVASPDPKLIVSPKLQALLEMDAPDSEENIAKLFSRVHPEDRRRLLKTFVGTVRRGGDLATCFRLKTSGNKHLWLSICGRAYRNDRQVARVAGVALDISARKRVEENLAELQLSNAKLAEKEEIANQELDSLYYSISHDLRAPLRSIRGFTEVVLERYASAIDPRGGEFLRRACASSHQMEVLIEGLLKLSRIGRAGFSRRWVDLTQLAHAIAADLLASDPSRHVEFRIAPGLTAQGDESLLRVVMENLLGNAWKFTSRTAGAQIEFGSSDLPECAFFVRDNGAGFDAAGGSRLFGVFQRLHSHTDFPGTGIGLAIVRRIIHRHGGRVWAVGQIERGATFFFTLPADEIR